MKIVLYCKGADDLIFTRLNRASPYQNKTKQHLNEFAADGLRTLCCAYRVLADDVFEDWYARYTEALGSIDNHDHRLSVLCDEIERDLILIGATAIEDKLQIDVGDTITSLLRSRYGF
jgi:magnesium-transporting ATPase (P-type)